MYICAMRLTTLQYRIKDQTSGKHLVEMGYSCNFVWNYCNEVNQERWKKFRKTFSAFDLNKLTVRRLPKVGLCTTKLELKKLNLI